MAGQQAIKTHQPAQQKATPPSAVLESPARVPIHPILGLQRTIGNRAVGRLLQAKLSIGQPGDRYEREGDQVADQVMRMPDPSSSEEATIAEKNQAAHPQFDSTHVPVTAPPIQRKPTVRSTGDSIGAPAFTTEREDADRVEHIHAEHTPPVNTTQSGHPLPFLDTIQSSFGRHDISHIRAHLDSAAAAKASAIGAEAFAHGSDVTFSRTPSLHTAAHEAAHVVQQRAGVSLKGGVGASGDEYEAHADRVGDAVVAGQSAEALLDSMVGRGGGLHAAVQRKEQGAAPSQPRLPMTAPIYARLHLGKIVDVLAKHLAAVKLPEPHPRLRWVSPDVAVDELVKEIRTYVNSDTSFGAIKLYELVYPADLWRLVDDGRGVAPDPNKPRTTVIGMIRDGPVGTAEWLPAVGVLIANALDPSIVKSVKRMGMRLRAQLDLPARMKKGGAVDVSAKRPPRTRNAPRVTERMLGPTDLVASHPLDRLVTEIMTTGNLEGSKRASGSKDDTPGNPFAEGVRRVEYYWLGLTDPKLWNWIEVMFPEHPTAEDVAHTIYTDFTVPNASRSDLAYLIRGSPPYFMIPAETAREIPAAWNYAPPELKDRQATRKPETVTDVLGLANSSIADEMALAQAPKQTKVDPDGEHALDRVGIQLRFLQSRLKPWGADAPLAPALAFIERRRREQALDPRAIERWSTLAVAQEKVLRTIATELAQILTDLGSRKMTGEDAEGLGPVADVLKAFAGAAGVSHMLGLVGPELASARRLHALMPLALTEAKVVATRQAVFEQQREQVSAGNVPSGALEIIQSIPDLASQAATLRSAANRGKAIDADAMEQLAVDADLMTLRARLMKLSIVLAAVEKRAKEVGLPDVEKENGYYTIRGANEKIRNKVGEWQRQAEAIKSEALKVKYDPISGSRTVRQRRIDHERRAVDALNRAMFDYDKQVNLGEHLKYAYERIADQQIRDMLVSIALELGITLLTGQVIGAGITLVRGLAVARRVAVAAELVGEARASRAVFAAADVVFQAGGATVVQGAMGRQVGGREFAENLIGNAVTRLALKPFNKLFADSAAIEKEVRAWAKFAMPTKRFVKQAVVDIGAGVAGSRVAHAVTHGEGLSLPGSDQMAIQGLSFLAGRLVARRVAEINQRIYAAAQRYGTRPFVELKQKTEALARQVQAAGKDVKPEVAAKLLESQHELLLYERDVYKKVPGGGDKAAVQNAQALGAMGPEFAEVPLRLAKLKSVVGDQVFEGSRQEIEAALRIANASGLPMVGTRDPKTGVWTMKVGDRTIEVHERAAGDAAARPAAAKPGTKTPAGGGEYEGKTPPPIPLPGGFDTPIGMPLPTEARALAVLRRLADNDVSALSEIGVQVPGSYTNPRGREWGIGQRKDGKFVIVQGGTGGVDWAAVVKQGIVPVAHSHPYWRSRAMRVPGVRIEELINDENNFDKILVLPSVEDFAVIARLKLAQHEVHVPYVHVGGGRIGNPDPSSPRTGITFVIRDAVKMGASEQFDYFHARIEVVSDGQPIWRGEVWAWSNFKYGGGQFSLTMPSHFKDATPETNVRVPTTSGTTPGAPSNLTTKAGMIKNANIDWSKQLSASGDKGSIARSGGGVYEGTIPGVSERVVFKVYPDNLTEKFLEDMAGAEVAAQKTSRAPEFYGEVDVGPGKRAFAMGYVPGGYPYYAGSDEANPRERALAERYAQFYARRVTEQTIQDVETYSRELLQAGYYCDGEMGGLVDSKGRWRAIDFQSIRSLPPKSDRAAYAAAIEEHTRNINVEKEKLAEAMAKHTR